MEEAGDDFCLCIPSLTHTKVTHTTHTKGNQPPSPFDINCYFQLSDYLTWCLNSEKDLPDKDVHLLLHPARWKTTSTQKSQTNDNGTRHNFPSDIKDEKNYSSNKVEDDFHETVKDEVDSDASQEFAQYSDWEDTATLLDQSPKETKVPKPNKATPGRKRGRPRKIPQISDDGNTDTDNDDPSWETEEKKSASVSKAVSTRKRGRPRKTQQVSDDDTSDTDNDDPVDVKARKGKSSSELVENKGKKKGRGSKWEKTILCPNCGQEFHRNPKKGGFPG